MRKRESENERERERERDKERDRSWIFAFHIIAAINSTLKFFSKYIILYTLKFLAYLLQID